MQLTKDADSTINTIRAYEPGRIRIGDHFFDCPLILTAAERREWESRRVDELELVHLDALLALDPEIVVLGCGETRLQPPARLIAALASRGVGIEAMDNGAACRTYNILVAEDRCVVLALQD